jgi:hypothetical protein
LAKHGTPMEVVAKKKREKSTLRSMNICLGKIGL